MRDLEQALEHALFKGTVNADNLNYSADLSMTILECRAFLQQLRTLKASLLPFALVGQEYRSDLFDANIVASSGLNGITIGDCRRAANFLCLSTSVARRPENPPSTSGKE